MTHFSGPTKLRNVGSASNEYLDRDRVILSVPAPHLVERAEARVRGIRADVPVDGGLQDAEQEALDEACAEGLAVAGDEEELARGQQLELGPPAVGVGPPRGLVVLPRVVRVGALRVAHQLDLREEVRVELGGLEAQRELGGGRGGRGAGGRPAWGDGAFRGVVRGGTGAEGVVLQRHHLREEGRGEVRDDAVEGRGTAIG